MNKLLNRKNKLGFTLTELIIVIAILAILAGILVPLMVGYLNDAKEATANANARTVYSAAAAAATMALANGKEAKTFTAREVSGLLASDYFQNKIKTLLGSNFAGLISVTVNNAGEVTNTTWQQQAGVDPEGKYPLATNTNP